jgi:Holliday junction resolvase RusA-like endonuclease
MMAERVKLEIPMEPRAQARPRAAAFKGADGRTRARMYKPQADTDAERDLFYISYNHPDRPPEPWTGPLGVSIWVMLRPPKTRRGKVWKDTKPDLDNYVKFALDALTRARFWEDDKQVARLNAEKIYSDDGPGWRIVIEKLR